MSPSNESAPGDLRDVRPPGHAGREHELFGLEDDPFGAPVVETTLDLDRPLLGVLVVRRPDALARAPVVELHHLRVHLQPVTDLVLRREDRPVLRELDVRKVVVPDRIVEAQRLVAVAPRVARPRVLLDDDRGHTELLEASTEADPSLPTADDHRVRLHGRAEGGLVGLLALEPALALLERTVLDALRAGGATRLLVTLQLDKRRQQRPALPITEADVTVAASRPRSRSRTIRQSRHRPRWPRRRA